MSEQLDLVDYRRRVGALYAGARAPTGDPVASLAAFRLARDELFSHHPQSALSPVQKQRFRPLRYFPYAAELRFELEVEPLTARAPIALALEVDGIVQLRPCGRIAFAVAGQPVSLTLFWIEGYGGGLFLPFCDLTSGVTSYGGGRYLIDTIKHADLGAIAGRLVVDFNYAYNPSCAYNARWVCPLAPAENRLPVAITAGEQLFED